MYLTEEEAKKKWCPMSRSGDGGTNRGSSDTNYPKIYADDFCVASGCMMWRREKDTYGDDYGKDIPETNGYCGLGGRP